MAKFVPKRLFKETLPCLGLIEHNPKDQVSLKNTIGSTEKKSVASTG
jgi:hypothetical protein